jgi:hypothetical protein
MDISVFNFLTRAWPWQLVGSYDSCVVLRVVGVLLIVVGVTVVICEVWAVDDVVDPGTVSVDDAVGSSIS